MTPKPVLLGYDLTHFTNFPEQLASRLEDHQTNGNIICHLIAAPLLGLAAFALMHQTAGVAVAITLQGMLVFWCMFNDIQYGIPYAVFNLTTIYTQIYYIDALLSIYQVLTLFGVGTFIQLGIGHGVFERRPPNELEGISKGDGYLFAILDFLCELVPATFHFYTILCLRCGFRPDLNHKVTLELHRIRKLIEQRDV